MELNAVPKAKATVQFEELPGMDEVGLDVPLDPPGALPDPESQIRAGLFPGRESATWYDIRREQPQSQVAIFRYIVFVPTADFSKDRQVIGGTSEGIGACRQSSPGPSPNQVIVRGKALGEQVLVGIVEP